MPDAETHISDAMVGHFMCHPEQWRAVGVNETSGWAMFQSVVSGWVIQIPPGWAREAQTYRESIGKVSGVKKTVYTGSQSYGTDIVLGEEYRDELSGFTGKAIGLYFYISGCERVELETFDEKRKELKGAIFDAGRLIHVATGKTATQQAPGGPDRGMTFRAGPTR